MSWKAKKAEVMMKIAGFTTQQHNSKFLQYLATFVAWLNVRRYGSDALGFLHEENSIDHLDYSQDNKCTLDVNNKPHINLSYNWIGAGFVIAGLMNFVGVLLGTLFFTHNIIQTYDSQVMSSFGLMIILLWGVAYMAMASSWSSNKLMVGTFIVVKGLYFLHWVNWIFNHNELLYEIYEQHFLSGLFYSIYGLNDLFFAIFFGYVILKTKNK
ncbi:hypothetical protein J8L84_18905 [Alteromonas sp. MMG017]|uniref:hypothetical protein n=1 Tax=Alteromonas sp. MMG017 TaxID=2822692 RepID=UPI001B3A5D36|nr:hypothetical protein [Alteromonas sp. MMG017]MBQ4831353.1 hypothetical protein [Alteromonas sp. MMG017]